MVKLLSILLVLFYSWSSPPEQPKGAAADKLRQHAHQLKSFAVTQKCSTKLGILIDMGIASRKNRFFVVDLEKDSVLVSGLCAHGQGNDVNREEVVFSNTPGSYCTSEGRYKLGEKFEGEFGTGYKLYGLDNTNSNALKRDIVFHAHPGVSDVEDPKVVTRSNGCPMVSIKVFRAAEKLIDAERKPVLMWVYK
jgi:L,D-transpeptidase catalytic domain